MTGILISKFRKEAYMSCGKKQHELGAGEKLRLCGKCRQAGYCSKNCQKVDWRKDHKDSCGTGMFDR